MPGQINGIQFSSISKIIGVSFIGNIQVSGVLINAGGGTTTTTTTPPASSFEVILHGWMPGNEGFPTSNEACITGKNGEIVMPLPLYIDPAQEFIYEDANLTIPFIGLQPNRFYFCMSPSQDPAIDSTVIRGMGDNMIGVSPCQ